MSRLKKTGRRSRDKVLEDYVKDLLDRFDCLNPDQQAIVKETLEGIQAVPGVLEAQTTNEQKTLPRPRPGRQRFSLCRGWHSKTTNRAPTS